jgi:cell division transport system ATP-binding protein
VAIARAVISRPSLLLADEPTGNVDDGIGVRLMYLFEELNKMGTTVVIATHNEGLVGRFSHRQLRIAGGTVRLVDPTAQPAPDAQTTATEDSALRQERA